MSGFVFLLLVVIRCTISGFANTVDEDIAAHNQNVWKKLQTSLHNAASQMQHLEQQTQQSLAHLEQRGEDFVENIHNKINAVIDHATHTQSQPGSEYPKDPIIVVDIPSQSTSSHKPHQTSSYPGTNYRQGQTAHIHPYSGLHIAQIPNGQFGIGQNSNSFPGVPQVPTQPFDIFRFYTGGFHEWWRGSNICIDRKEIEEPPTNVSGIFFSFHTSQCIDTETSHTCTTKLQSHGIRKTFIITYQCCHGYQRDEHTGICEKVNTKPMMDTLRSMGGGMFADLISYTGLADKFNNENLTVFCPTDEALKTFTDDYQDNTIVVKPVKRRSVDNHDLVLSHTIPGFLNAADFVDEQILYSQSSDATIRTNVYHMPNRAVTANCIPVKLGNQHAMNGVAHLLDGVLLPVTRSLSDLISNDRQFTILKTLLNQAGLDGMLKKEGQYTLFAPTDDAFRQMDPLVLRKLLSGEGCPSSILKYHILPNVVCSGVLPEKARSATMLGSDVKLRRDDDDNFFVNDKPIIQQNQMGTNGVMHVIDGVLIPEEAKSVTGVLDEWQLTDVLDLLENANMLNSIDAMQNITFFAPTNEAVQDAAPILNELRQSPGKLQDALMYHIAQPSLSTCHIDNNQQISTASGSKSLRFNQYYSMEFGLTHHITVQCARILEMDRKACGATIQLVDRVLLPPEGHLVDILSSNQTFSIMRKLLRESFLERELNEHGPYTVLAPTDQAFESLPKDQLKEILNDRDQADRLVRNHILPEVLCCTGIRQSHWFIQKSARTLAGHAVPMNRHYDAILIGSAHIIKCDIMADNGVVHAINRVLFPPRPHYQPHSSYVYI